MARPATGSGSVTVFAFSEPRKGEHGADSSYQNLKSLCFSAVARLPRGQPQK